MAYDGRGSAFGRPPTTVLMSARKDETAYSDECPKFMVMVRRGSAFRRPPDHRPCLKPSGPVRDLAHPAEPNKNNPTCPPPPRRFRHADPSGGNIADRSHPRRDHGSGTQNRAEEATVPPVRRNRGDVTERRGRRARPRRTPGSCRVQHAPGSRAPKPAAGAAPPVATPSEQQVRTRIGGTHRTTRSKGATQEEDTYEIFYS